MLSARGFGATVPDHANIKDGMAYGAWLKWVDFDCQSWKLN